MVPYFRRNVEGSPLHVFNEGMLFSRKGCCFQGRDVVLAGARRGAGKSHTQLRRSYLNDEGTSSRKYAYRSDGLHC